MKSSRLSSIIDLLKNRLSNNDIPFYIDDKYHSYNDLFKIMEELLLFFNKNLLFIFSSIFNDNLQTIINWSKLNSVILQFQSIEQIEFIRKEEKQIKTQTNRELSKGIISFITGQYNKIIKEYYWKYIITYKIIVIKGNNKEIIEILNEKQIFEIKTISQTLPKPKYKENNPISIKIHSFFNNYIEINGLCKRIFINNNNNSTPTHNNIINDIYEFTTILYNWCLSILSYLNDIISIKHSNINIISQNICHLNCYPILIQHSDSNIYDYYYNDKYNGLKENEKLLENDKEYFRNLFSLSDNYITNNIITFITWNRYLYKLCSEFFESFQYLEDVQRNNLLNVLGKRLYSCDIYNIMDYQYKLLFKEEYQPKSFIYNINNSNNNDSEGVISLYYKENNNIIKTFNNHIQRLINMNITASINIKLQSTLYIHCFIKHEFDTTTSLISKLQLQGRAKQYSSFILLIGNVLSNDKIDCKYATIVRNGDYINIPLNIEALATAKAYKKSISSLSNTQKEFSNAYRSMQLEGSLFVITTIPLQPQIEQVLLLPINSLTKHIELLEQILELMITYQIPTDLLKYSGPSNISTCLKIQQVKESINSIYYMINEEKEESIKEEKRKKELEILKNIPKSKPPISNKDNIYYAGIGKGNKIIVSNGSDMSYEHILNKIILRFDISSDIKKSYNIAQSKVTIHLQVVNQIIYFCVADESVKGRLCYQFLQRLIEAYNINLSYTELNQAILRYMDYTLNEENDKIERIKREIDQVKETMLMNIESVLERGEKIEDLTTVSEDLAYQSMNFRMQAKTLNTWNNPFKNIVNTTKSAISTFNTPNKTISTQNQSINYKKEKSLSNSSSREENISIGIDSIKDNIISTSNKEELNNKEIPTINSSSREKNIPIDVDSINDNITNTSNNEENNTHRTNKQDTGTSNTNNISIEEYSPIINNNDNFDIISIPSKLDKEFEKNDKDDAIHSTIIKVKEKWIKHSQTLLGNTIKSKLLSKDINEEYNKSIDLLDSISRSGDLKLIKVNIHYIIGLSYWFNKSVINTLLKDNINPITKLEQTGIQINKILNINKSQKEFIKRN